MQTARAHKICRSLLLLLDVHTALQVTARTGIIRRTSPLRLSISGPHDWPPDWTPQAGLLNGF
jgi:hypothetical protein